MKLLLKKALPVVLSFIIVTAVVLAFVYWRIQTISSQVDKDLQGFSLSTVTDDDVVNKITHSAHRVRDHYSGMSSGADYTLYRREDHDRFSRTAEIDHGFDVVSASKVINGHLTLKIHSSLEAGEGKIAIIQDNKVIEYLPFGANVTREYDVKGESLFLVKTVCDNAKISIKIERTIVTHD